MDGYKIKNRIIVEKDTVKHRIAQQTMVFEGYLSLGTKTYMDMLVYCDNGNPELYVLYLDMVTANMASIRKEDQQRLKV